MRTFVVSLSGLMVAIVTAAEIAVCPGDAMPPAGPRYVHDLNLFFSRGTPLRIVAYDGPGSALDCEVFGLPVAADRILWLGPAQVDRLAPAGNAVTLQGTFGPQGTVVSEIIWPDGGATASPWHPFGGNLLKGLSPAVFGREGRARFKNSTLTCEAGTEPAGVLLHAGKSWPASTPLQLALTYTMPSGRGRFQVGVSDSEGLKREAPTQLGFLEAAGDQPHGDGNRVRREAFVLPVNPAGWTAFTLACPGVPAAMNLRSVEVMPIPAESGTPRSAWVWSPRRWESDPESIWKLGELERIREVFVTVPVAPDGTVEKADALHEFVRESRRRGILVHAVIGDPRDVLPESLPALLARVKSYADYNAAAADSARLQSVQLDIEPYLLPGFPLAMEHWRARYVQTIRAVHAALQDRLALDLVVPVWWGAHPAWGRAFLRELEFSNASLTVMNYRTRPDALRDGALPFLEWGREHGRKVRIALETGSLPDETRRTFRRGPKGGAMSAELWLFPDMPAPLLVLLDGPASRLGGEPYAFSHEYLFSASRLTFGGDQARLHAVADLMVREWSAWPSFAGLALHGLDEAYPE